MNIVSLAIADVKLITPKRFSDERGFFSETYNAQAFAAAGIACTFVQDNHSLSVETGTLRGLHFQRPPFAQAKLVRCTRGRIYDVAVDLRSQSDTYGHWVAAELSQNSWSQLYVPAGFAHGFVTLEPQCEVLYKVDAFYAPEHDAGVLWSDPDLAIDWPLSPAGPRLSAKDARLPSFKQLGSVF